MRAILVHGMFRSPLSQLVLASRLRSAGIRVHLFGYSTFRPFESSLRRFVNRVSALPADEPFVLIGHSLGCVLIRASLPRLARQPSACFFLAPPNRVPLAARYFAANRLYRLLTRDCGQLLNDEAFMSSLPVPDCAVRVYAGTAGPKGRLSPFLRELNDGVLTVSETELSSEHPSTLVPSLHTFIMNSERVANDMTSAIASLPAANQKRVTTESDPTLY